MKFWFTIALMCLASPIKADDALFRDRVAPIFERHCIRCHSGTRPKGGFSLTARASALAASESGVAIIPGKPNESLLLNYISGEKPEMPKDAKPLSNDELTVIRQWISAGADWPEETELVDKRQNDTNWWSLLPLERPDVPKIQSITIRTPIDAFHQAKLREQRLTPAPETDRRTLIRRLTFDLTGLPPTPEEVDAFVADIDPQAYEKLINKLLASSAYGERWGRHWLDVAHYADTHGYDKDKTRPNAWPYRDYVINAFNNDKPYSRFILEQIAGDRLFPETPEGIIATGFIAAGPFDFVGQIEVAEGTLQKAVTRNLDRDDMVATTINTFNSMTAQCARCHNHKFDPISQQDYYNLQAVFAGVDRADRTYVLDVKADDKTADTGVVFAAATEFAPQDKFTPTHGKPRPVFVLNRGSEASPGAEAHPSACSYLPQLSGKFELAADATEADGRAALARWLADKRNSLTWRSIVNRVWQYHFGRGLVDSPNDFGRMGTLPSHPELLNWLAVEFRDGGDWVKVPESIKDLHRLICNSAVYRQSSAGNAENEKLDAGNQYLWRMNRRKLEAEAVRDSILSVAGKLDRTSGGPGFYLFGFVDDHSPHYTYEEHDPDDARSCRRSVYRFIVRSVPDPFMTTLDCADSSQVVAKRSETLTPLQALALLNNQFVVRMSEHLADRVASESPELSSQLKSAWQLAFGRWPTQDELQPLVEFATRHGLAGACRLIFNANEFVFID